MADAAVLVTGATGLIGRRLVERLVADGVPVRALSRDTSRAVLPEAVELVGWNGRNVPAEALFRTRAVVHLAGEPVFGGAMTEARKRRIHDSRVQSTREIVSGMEALPAADRPGTFLCASAVGFYGSRGDDLLDEDEPPGDGFLAQVCMDWEREASRAEELGVRRVSLRIGIALARGGGALAPMLPAFRMGLGARLGSGSQWFPWVHVDDVVGIAHAALGSDAYRGAVNATAPHPVTNRDFTKALAAALSRPAFLAVPAPFLRLAGQEIADELLGSRRVTPRVAQERGYAFLHPELAGALADVLSR